MALCDALTDTMLIRDAALALSISAVSRVTGRTPFVFPRILSTFPGHAVCCINPVRLDLMIFAAVPAMLRCAQEVTTTARQLAHVQATANEWIKHERRKERDCATITMRRVVMDMAEGAVWTDSELGADFEGFRVFKTAFAFSRSVASAEGARFVAMCSTSHSCSRIGDRTATSWAGDRFAGPGLVVVGKIPGADRIHGQRRDFDILPRRTNSPDRDKPLRTDRRYPPMRQGATQHPRRPVLLRIWSVSLLSRFVTWCLTFRRRPP